MTEPKRFTRRQILKYGACAMGATVALGPASMLAAPVKFQDIGRPSGRRLIPGTQMGTITYTQRDVPGRLGITASAAAGVTPTMGYLGGPDFPADQDDLGPLVPLPGGWYELLGFLAGLGYRQIEFAGYGQNAANPGGTAGPTEGGVVTPASRAAYLAYAHRLRGFLDEFHLDAVGNHGYIPNTWPGPSSAGGVMDPAHYERFLLELEFASILGMPYMGTGGDPASANNRNIEAWDIGVEKWEAINEIATREWGIQMYPHNHSPAYNFLQDGPMVEVTEDRVTGAPITPTMVRAESGKRLMQHYLDNTDSHRVVVEMDVYWATVAQHQWRWRYDFDGTRVEDIFDPTEQVAKQTKRYALFHAKDGESTGADPGVGSGYSIVPFGNGDVPYPSFYGQIGALRYHNSQYEQDNAPGGSSDPGRSLRHSVISAKSMTQLTG